MSDILNVKINGEWVGIPLIKGDTGPTGPQGETGPQGSAGYTPIRGTDYWTTADKEEIVNDVLAEIQDYDEESF